MHANMEVNLHMFLDIMELIVKKTKKLSLDKTVLQMWCQIKKKWFIGRQCGLFNLDIFSVSDILLT